MTSNQVLTKAPYTHQYTFFVHRYHLLSGIYHKQVLRRTTIDHLWKVDIQIVYVIKLLDLLHNVPSHALLPQLQLLALVLILCGGQCLQLLRLETFLHTYDLGGLCCGRLRDFINGHISKLHQYSLYDEMLLTITARVRIIWTSCMYEAV